MAFATRPIGLFFANSFSVFLVISLGWSSFFFLLYLYHCPMMKVIFSIWTLEAEQTLFGILSSLHSVKRLRRLGCILLLSLFTCLRLSKLLYV